MTKRPRGSGAKLEDGLPGRGPTNLKLNREGEVWFQSRVSDSEIAYPRSICVPDAERARDMLNRGLQLAERAPNAGGRDIFA
jgi:hypothetical protein